MTIATAINRSGPYTGNGVTTVFDYEFKIEDETHIQAIRATALNVETILEIDADYTVTGVGDEGGGTIVLNSALASGLTVTFLLNVPFTQETDLENQGAYYAETVEAALDLAAQRDLQLAERMGRAILLPASSEDAGGELAAQLAADITRLGQSADEIDAVSGVVDEVSALSAIVDDIALLADVSAVLAGTASAVRMSEKVFTGDGADTTWTLDRAPGVDENVLVWVGGAIQNIDDYSVSGVTLTISPAVANGVEIRTLIMTLVTANDIEAMRDEAAASRAEAVAAAASINQRIYTSVSLASGDTITAAVKRVRTQFLAPSFVDLSTLVGGANYRRATASEIAGLPAQAHFRSLDRFLPNGAIDAATGGHWLLDEAVVDWRMLGVMANGSDDTAAAQAAINFCAASPNNRLLRMVGIVYVSKLVFPPGINTARSDNCFVVANSGSAQTSLIEVKAPNFCTDGRLVAIVGYRSNYECAFHLWNEASLQFFSIRNWIPNGAKIGFRVGNKTYPTALISEGTIDAGNSYGCPVVFEVIGLETYLTISSPQVTADAFGGDGAWSALERIGVRNIGANVTIDAGSVESTAVGTGVLFESQPLERTAGNADFGSFRVHGVMCESALPIFRSANPDGLTINSIYNNRARIEIASCFGYHSQDSSAFIYCDPTFKGDLIVSKPGFWHSGGTRANANIYCEAGSDVDVFCNDDFGPGFIRGMSGIVGGKLHFAQSEIVRAISLSGVAFTSASGFQDCPFSIVEPAPDKTRFAQYYNPATGEFTVPSWGLSDVEVVATVRLGIAVSGALALFEDGVEICRTYGTNGCFNLSHAVGIGYAGRKLKVALDVDTNASGSVSGFLNVLSIRARN